MDGGTSVGKLVPCPADPSFEFALHLSGEWKGQYPPPREPVTLPPPTASGSPQVNIEAFNYKFTGQTDHPPNPLRPVINLTGSLNVRMAGEKQSTRANRVAVLNGLWGAQRRKPLPHPPSLFLSFSLTTSELWLISHRRSRGRGRGCVLHAPHERSPHNWHKLILDLTLKLSLEETFSTLTSPDKRSSMET